MRQILRIFALLLFSLPTWAAEMPRAESADNLTILADEQMLLPLAQIARSYAMQTDTPLTVVVKDAENAAHQIEQGLEAHIIITANQPLISRLAGQGLTDVTSRKTIARTQLALVTANRLSKQALVAKRVSFAAMLAATPDLPVLANSPDSYDGARAIALLQGHEFSAALATRLQPKSGHEELIESLRDSEGLGLILAADAATENDISILALLPEDISQPVVYDAVVLGSESMSEAKALVNYLTSNAAQKTFTRFGFQPPTK